MFFELDEIREVEASRIDGNDLICTIDGIPGLKTVTMTFKDKGSLLTFLRRMTVNPICESDGCGRVGEFEPLDSGVILCPDCHKEWIEQEREDRERYEAVWNERQNNLRMG